MNEILDAPTSSPQEYRYAGFWIRVVALLIDGVAIVVVQAAIAFIAFDGVSYFTTPTTTTTLISLLLNGTYLSVMESSARQGSLGKIAVGIKVIDKNGGRITLVQGLIRYAPSALTSIATLLGAGPIIVGILALAALGVYISVAIDQKNQGLHDKASSTFVVYNN